MKIRIAVDPDATHEVTIIERDRPSGRDLTVFNGKPGDIYEFDLNADTYVFTQQGQRVREDDGDGDGGGGGMAGTGVLLDEGMSPTEFQAIPLNETGEVEQLNERSTDAEVASTPPAKPDEVEEQTDGEQGGGESEPGGGEQSDAGTGEQTQADTEQQTQTLGDPSDDDVRAVLADLESNPSVERTAQGVVQVTTINKALEAKGFKPINAARRDALAAG